MAEPAVAVGAVRVHSVVESLPCHTPDVHLPNHDARALAERVAPWTRVSFRCGPICSPVRSCVLQTPDGDVVVDLVATRHAFSERCARERALVFGEHCEEPAVGRIRPDGGGYRFEPIEV